MISWGIHLRPTWYFCSRTSCTFSVSLLFRFRNLGENNSGQTPHSRFYLWWYSRTQSWWQWSLRPDFRFSKSVGWAATDWMPSFSWCLSFLVSSFMSAKSLFCNPGPSGSRKSTLKKRGFDDLSYFICASSSWKKSRSFVIIVLFLNLIKNRLPVQVLFWLFLIIDKSK